MQDRWVSLRSEAMKMLGERPKNSEELNAVLYEKVSLEFEEYKNNLIWMSSEEMLAHTYAYAVCSDSVVAIECGQLYVRQSQALLKVGNSLDEIRQVGDFRKQSYGCRKNCNRV